MGNVGKLFTILAIIMFITGCGSGGSSSNNTPTEFKPDVTPASRPEPVPIPKPDPTPPVPSIEGLIVDYGWPIKAEDIPNYKEQEAIIFFVGFKHLRRKPPFDWGGSFTGKRIMYDFDACQNYGCGIGTSPYKGKWPEVFKRQEFDLLLLLIINKNKVFSREELLEIIWGYEYFGDVRTVDVHVRRLREKVESDSSNPEYIVTKWGVGYYFRDQ